MEMLNENMRLPTLQLDLQPNTWQTWPVKFVRDFFFFFESWIQCSFCSVLLSVMQCLVVHCETLRPLLHLILAWVSVHFVPRPRNTRKLPQDQKWKLKPLRTKTKIVWPTCQTTCRKGKYNMQWQAKDLVATDMESSRVYWEITRPVSLQAGVFTAKRSAGHGQLICWHRWSGPLKSKSG